MAHRRELNDTLAAVFRTSSSQTWETRLAEAGIPCAPVNRVDAVFREEQVAATGLVQDVEHPSGPVRLVASPLTLDGQRPPIRRAPPLFGEHTAEILDALAGRAVRTDADE